MYFFIHYYPISLISDKDSGYIYIKINLFVFKTKFTKLLKLKKIVFILMGRKQKNIRLFVNTII